MSKHDEVYFIGGLVRMFVVKDGKPVSCHQWDEITGHDEQLQFPNEIQDAFEESKELGIKVVPNHCGYR